MCPYTSNKHSCFFMFLVLNTIDTSYHVCKTYTVKHITPKKKKNSI